MKFRETELAGVWLIDLERHEDERGFFARSWCAIEATAVGLKAACVQCSISYNRLRGTLRGMHWQAPPHVEAKWVRCIRGAIWDVALDLRDASPTFRRWVGVELTAANGRMIYIPEGVAHGFQTLEDATEVSYMMSAPYVPKSARGVRWNDPAFGIQWPIPNPILSQRDQRYGDFTS